MSRPRDLTEIAAFSASIMTSTYLHELAGMRPASETGCGPPLSWTICLPSSMEPGPRSTTVTDRWTSRGLLHASYEDKPGAPDRIFAGFRLSWPLGRWRLAAPAERVGPPDPLVLHLHHLTPWHDAAEAVWPDVPVVTNLHGTELLILEQIGQDDAAESDGSRIGSPVWRYADYWAHGCVLLPSAARTSSRHRLIMPPARFAFLVSWIA